MPWTVSHAAAVLPLRRYTSWPLDFGALVVGSMTPDLGYYIDQFDLATAAHTLRGSFLVGLPTGVIVLLAFYLWAKPVVHLLPRPHRLALAPICPSLGGLRPARWLILLGSLLAGIWTHNFWDAFTHDKGWFVQRISWLRDPVVRIGGASFGLPFVLQILSTFVGLALVVAAYIVWLRREKFNRREDRGSDRWRYLLALALGLVALLIALPAALHFAADRHGVLFARAVMFRVAIYAPAVAIPLGLLTASVIYLRRPPA